MKKNIEEIMKHLESVRTERDSKQQKLLKEVAAAERKAEEIDKALKTVEDPDDYRRLLNEQRDNNQFLSFLRSHKPKGFRPAITGEDYRSINQTIDAEINDLQEEYAPKVWEEMQKLLSILDEYSEQVEPLEAIKHEASFLFTSSTGNFYKAAELKNKEVDPTFYYFHLCREYFNHRLTINRLKSAVGKQSNGFFSVCNNPEEHAILEELTRRAN